MDLESRYSKLEKDYKQLSIEYNILRQAYDKLKRSRKKHKQKISVLQDELNKFKNNRYSDSNHLNVSPQRRLESLSIFSPKPVRRLTNPPDSASTNQSSGKILQANPDQSVQSDHSISYIYEAFFVVGLGKDDLSTSLPKILFEYHTESDPISEEILKVIPNICFPTGCEPRKLKLSGSASDLNGVLYSQVPIKRSENCFIFTLRAEDAYGDQQLHPDVPNCELELLYFICIKIEDLCVDEAGSEWVVPKCYVLSTYVPVFDLHFEFLQSLLLLKRLYRTQLIANGDGNAISSLVECECCKDEIDQLNKYAQCECIEPGLKLELGIDKIEELIYLCPENLSTIDLVWLCMPLFTSLRFNDFFWLLSAVLQEKSIIFISKNLGLLSSCVLGICALLRPFKWYNLTVSIVPDSLKEILDAPIPVIAGIPSISNQERLRYPNIIWVVLDEPSLDRKIRGSGCIVSEVIELEAPELKKSLSACYKSFDTETFLFTGNPEQKSNCLKIAEELKKYFNKIIDAFKGTTVLDETELTRILLHNFPTYDHKFVRAFVQTMIFNNKLEIE